MEAAGKEGALFQRQRCGRGRAERSRQRLLGKAQGGGEGRRCRGRMTAGGGGGSERCGVFLFLGGEETHDGRWELVSPSAPATAATGGDALIERREHSAAGPREMVAAREEQTERGGDSSVDDWIGARRGPAAPGTPREVAEVAGLEGAGRGWRRRAQGKEILAGGLAGEEGGGTGNATAN